MDVWACAHERGRSGEGTRSHAHGSPTSVTQTQRNRLAVQTQTSRRQTSGPFVTTTKTTTKTATKGSDYTVEGRLTVDDARSLRSPRRLGWRQRGRSTQCGRRSLLLVLAHPSRLVIFLVFFAVAVSLNGGR